MEAPTPANEFERLIELSELDLDYTNLEDNLEDLTQLAARIVGTQVSLVNLIDSYTQWSVADYGIDIQQSPREDSICQYTILEEDSLEIKDLSKDERFKEKNYVKNEPSLRYYYGVPLETSGGANIGALCVLDTESKDIAPEDKELLKMIARQVVRRLEALKKIKELEERVENLNQKKRKISHDLRNPLSGIVGLADIMEDEVKNDRVKEVLELAEMIKKGGTSLLELVEEIMDQDENGQEKHEPGKNEFSCQSFADKLKEMYQPQAKSKGVNLNINAKDSADDVFFPKSKLLQIVGNLITNSIKFTDEDGSVDVQITVNRTNDDSDSNELFIMVEDTGVGMEEEKVQEILQGQASSEGGTKGEKGYGFGMSLVKHLVDKAEGTMQIEF
ncbi:MAG: GAF domain-containing sensor histidine kinase [Fodinibius sp.]|nr:GAF domain-containing sensor histidine kinase [Fodinibius sp.]